MTHTTHWKYITNGPEDVGWQIGPGVQPANTRPCWVWKDQHTAAYLDSAVSVVEIAPDQYWVCEYRFDREGRTVITEKHTNLEAALVSATLTNLEVIHASE